MSTISPQPKKISPDLANVIAASFTRSSFRFFTIRIFRGFVGHVNLYTFPAGEVSSRVGLCGTVSGFRKGNVGGGDDDEGGLCRSVGMI